MGKVKERRCEDSLRRVYDFIVEYMTSNGFASSICDICGGVGLASPSSVHNCLEKLEDRGLIEVKENTPRAIKLVGYHFEKD